MKFYVVLIGSFTLLFTSACDQIPSQKKPQQIEQNTAAAKKTVLANDIIKTERKTVAVKKKTLKPIQKKKIKLSSKVKRNRAPTISETKVEEEEQLVEKRVLDLTIPDSVTKISKAASISKEHDKHLLPDLFVKDSHRKKQSMSVAGKFIKRSEKEEEKAKIADGAGISISLTH